MEQLELTFGDGQISGSGQDVIGPFTLQGEVFAGGRTLIEKHYVGQHHVEYHGTFDGEGTLQGIWNIVGQTGNWMIRVVKGDGNRQVRELEAIPDWSANSPS